MSDASTKKMISAYIERSATPMPFLSGFFQSPRENYHSTEEVEIDVQRNGEDVAIVVQDLGVGGRNNEASRYTNKTFIPPIYDERFSLNSFDLLKREPGMSPFEDVNFMAAAARNLQGGMRRMEEKIRRAIELQAAQVLQNGTLVLTDAAGVALYSLDYKPKTTHFPTVGTSWVTSTTKLADLESLADVIHVDGKSEPEKLILGKTALRYFLADAAVQAQLDNLRMDLGQIGRPQVRGGGGKYHGTISIGQYTFELYSYAGWYKHPQTGAATPYVDADSVIMLAPGRLDLSFGAIPRIVPPDPRLAGLPIGRVVNSEGGMDMDTNAWVSDDGRNIHAAVAARPLCIPTAIDTFGCLDVIP